MNGPAELSSVALVIANLCLGMIVAVPLLLVGGAVLKEVVGRIRRRRRIVWVELPGVGRIPVLRE
jgi:hypothetical protein